MGIFKRFALLALCAFVSSTATAEYYSQDTNYIYRETPYSEYIHQQDGIRDIAVMAHSAFLTALESLHKAKIFPEAVLSMDDIRQYKEAQGKIDDLVDYLNSFITEERKRPGAFDFVDLVPDAFMIFGGTGFSLNLGVGGGASAQLGVIIMPVKVEKYDKRTGQLVSTRPGVNLSLIGWPSGNLGFGAGGGGKLRVGAGVIWDLNDAFVRAEQFWGVGAGSSWTPVMAGAGINVKTGVVSNWEMPGWVDFAYATAAWEFGPAAEVTTPHINVTTFISGPAILGMLDRSSQKVMTDILKDMEKSMNEFMRKHARGEGTNEAEETPGKNIRPR